jgi:hypothetical protein
MFMMIYQCADYWREDSRSYLITYDRDFSSTYHGHLFTVVRIYIYIANEKEIRHKENRLK